MSGYTKGEWKAHVMTREVSVEAPCGRVLFLASVQSDDEAVADARLIAAAPELLSIAERWAALDGGSWAVQRHANEKAELLEETRAAIAKATGEQP